MTAIHFVSLVLDNNKINPEHWQKFVSFFLARLKDTQILVVIPSDLQNYEQTIIHNNSDALLKVTGLSEALFFKHDKVDFTAIPTTMMTDLGRSPTPIDKIDLSLRVIETKINTSLSKHLIVIVPYRQNEQDSIPAFGDGKGQGAALPEATVSRIKEFFSSQQQHAQSACVLAAKDITSKHVLTLVSSFNNTFELKLVKHDFEQNLKTFEEYINPSFFKKLLASDSSDSESAFLININQLFSCLLRETAETINDFQKKFIAELIPKLFVFMQQKSCTVEKQQKILLLIQQLSQLIDITPPKYSKPMMVARYPEHSAEETKVNSAYQIFLTMFATAVADMGGADTELTPFRFHLEPQPPKHPRADHWTDDTSMMLCLADYLCSRDPDDPKSLPTLFKQFVAWYEKGLHSGELGGPMLGIGPGTRRALSIQQPTFSYTFIYSIQRQIIAEIKSFGPEKHNYLDQCDGNGTLMRLGAMALTEYHAQEKHPHQEDEQILYKMKLAYLQSICTAPSGLDAANCARFWTFLLHCASKLSTQLPKLTPEQLVEKLLSEENIERFITLANQQKFACYLEDFKQEKIRELSEKFLALLKCDITRPQNNWRASVRDYAATLKIPRHSSDRFGIYVLDQIPFLLNLLVNVKNNQNFSSLLAQVISSGGDADTNAAVFAMILAQVFLDDPEIIPYDWIWTLNQKPVDVTKTKKIAEEPTLTFFLLEKMRPLINNPIVFDQLLDKLRQQGFLFNPAEAEYLLSDPERLPLLLEYVKKAPWTVLNFASPSHMQAILSANKDADVPLINLLKENPSPNLLTNMFKKMNYYLQVNSPYASTYTQLILTSLEAYRAELDRYFEQFSQSEKQQEQREQLPLLMQKMFGPLAPQGLNLYDWLEQPASVERLPEECKKIRAILDDLFTRMIELAIDANIVKKTISPLLAKKADLINKLLDAEKRKQITRLYFITHCAEAIRILEQQREKASSTYRYQSNVYQSVAPPTELSYRIQLQECLKNLMASGKLGEASWLIKEHSSDERLVNEGQLLQKLLGDSIHIIKPIKTQKIKITHRATKKDILIDVLSFENKFLISINDYHHKLQSAVIYDQYPDEKILFQQLKCCHIIFSEGLEAAVFHFADENGSITLQEALGRSTPFQHSRNVTISDETQAEGAAENYVELPSVIKITIG